MLDDIHDNLVLFLQCALFTILKAHGIYPADAFVRVRLLGHLCWWGVSPEVERYVTRLCDSLRPSLCRESLSRLRLRRQHDKRRSSDARGCGGESNLEQLKSVIIDFGEDAVKRLEVLGVDGLCKCFGLALLRLETFLAATAPPASQDPADAPDPPATAPTWAVEVDMKGSLTDAAAQAEHGKVLGPCWGMPRKRRRLAARRTEEDHGKERVLHPLVSITAGQPEQSVGSSSNAGGNSGVRRTAALSVYAEVIRWHAP